MSSSFVGARGKTLNGSARETSCYPGFILGQEGVMASGSGKLPNPLAAKEINKILTDPEIMKVR